MKSLLNNNMQATNDVLDLIRFSTAEQTAEGRSGEARQATLIDAAHSAHGLRGVKRYTIIDVSGRHVKYDADFQQFLKDLTRADIKGVAVSEQSRIFRPEDFEDYAILSHFVRNRKLIYTPSGVIDPCTPEGRMVLTLNGMMSGEELIKIKERCNSGKEELRKKGAFPGGNQMLPRGVRFVRERNDNGKVVATRWEHDGIDSVLMTKAFEYLFAGDSCEVIASKIGNGWSGKGVRDSLMNPIWKSVMRYAYEAKGDEYLPKATAKNPKPKIRRRLTKREQALEIRLDGLDGRPFLAQLISDEAWERAQEILGARTAKWRKSKLANAGRERHLVAGIARCSCGEILDNYYGARGSHLDAYKCASKRKKCDCGMKPLKRADVDAAIERLISERLLNADFILSVVELAKSAAARPVDPIAQKRAETKAKLANGRKELLRSMRKGDITADEFKEQVAELEVEVRALEATLPAAAPETPAAEIVEMLAEAFASFADLTSDDKRKLLRGAIRDVTIDGRAVASVTISGGYLGSVAGVGIEANCSLRSRPQYRNRFIPDIVLRLPEPFAIADTYVDRRASNGNAESNLDALRRGRNTRWGLVS